MSARADGISILGTAGSYGVLGASTITNSGPTIISGDLGLYGGTSVTGFPSGTVTNGAMHVNDGPARAAMADASAGYMYLSALAPTQNLTGHDLGGQTLGSGVYSFDTSAALNGALTLDFQNVSNADIIFIVGTSFITSANSAMIVARQGLNNNIYFVVGSSAALGADSSFAGAILAGTSISLGTGAGSTCGSVAALDGAVTLLSNNITNCSSTGSNVTPFTADVSPSPVPEPGTLALLATGLIVGAATLRGQTAKNKVRRAKREQAYSGPKLHDGKVEQISCYREAKKW